MQKTLRWMLPIAENTTRAHQGFGWVGEWANFGSDMDEKSGSRHGVTWVQTLHHADKAATEQHMLELVVLLHHLVMQVKSRGYGHNKSGRSRSSRRRPSSEALQSDDTRHTTSPMNNNSGGACPSPLSDSERETLDHLSFRRTTSYGRSKSCEPRPGRASRAHRSWDACRSHGSSPAREMGRCSASGCDQMARDLDVIDGLGRLTLSSFS